MIINPECNSICHQERLYRNVVQSDLAPRQVVVQETDLLIYADEEIADAAKEAIITERGYLERYIDGHPEFLHTLSPWPEDPMAPTIVQRMIHAGRLAQVGPMAAVAGAIAEKVGEALTGVAQEVIIENGGDVFISCCRDLTVAIYADQSPLSLKVGIRLPEERMPVAVCSSSGKVGHSFSAGKADAVCVVSASCALADAAATAMGNRVKTESDIAPAIEWAKSIEGIDGGVVILGEKMGVWGQIELIPVATKKG